MGVDKVCAMVSTLEVGVGHDRDSRWVMVAVAGEAAGSTHEVAMAGSPTRAAVNSDLRLSSFADSCSRYHHNCSSAGMVSHSGANTRERGA